MNKTVAAVVESPQLDNKVVKQYLDRIFDSSKEVMAIPFETHQQQLGLVIKEDLSFSLVAPDIFCEEMRVIVMNTDNTQNVFSR